MCIRYLTTIWENGFISLWIMGMCRSWRSITIVVCIVPFIRVVIIMGGGTNPPVGIAVGGEWHIYQVFGWWLLQGICCCNK